MPSERKFIDFASSDEVIKSIKNGFTGESNPEFFNLSAMPATKEKKPGQLPEEMIRKFFEDGYVVVENYFTKEELDPCKEAANDLVEELAQKLYKSGRIKKLYKDYGFDNRLTKIEAEFPGATVLFFKLGNLHQAIKDIWSNERLLNVVEQLIGSEIAGHPVWNMRPKAPQNEATTVPWHQDVCYLDNDCYNVLTPTAWIPLLDADESNGCLQFAHRGHKTGRVAKHLCCAGGTWYTMLEEEEMVKTLEIDPEKDFVICPIPYGGMVLFNNLIPHRSLPNFSKTVRWSMDFRWQNPNLPCGFFGLAEPILMRTSKDPNYKVQWEKIEDTKTDPRKSQAANPKEEDKGDFDTTIQGPWMFKWELVHTNRHTARIEEKLKSMSLTAS